MATYPHFPIAWWKMLRCCLHDTSKTKSHLPTVVSCSLIHFLLAFFPSPTCFLHSLFYASQACFPDELSGPGFVSWSPCKNHFSFVSSQKQLFAEVRVEFYLHSLHPSFFSLWQCLVHSFQEALTYPFLTQRVSLCAVGCTLMDKA